MRPILIILLFVFTTILNLRSQNISCCYDSASEKVYEQKIFAKLFVNPLINNNNQFYYNWMKGKIDLTNGVVINNELLRLNRYINELLWLRKSDYKTGIIDKSMINSFSLYGADNKVFKKFLKVRIKNWYAADSIDVFVELLTEGEISLAVFRTSRLNKNSNELTLKNIYYILKNGNPYNIKPGKRGLYSKSFIDKVQMKSVIKTNHLRVRKEEGMKTAIELYNKQNNK